MRTALLASTLLASALLAGCSDPASDGPDDDFIADGKADSQFAEGSPEALGVLTVVNTLDETELDDTVGLHAHAARNIAKHRAGADAALETPDDDRFDSLAELDAVPYVGPVAFGKLLAYAQDHGYITTTPTWTQENPTPDSLTRHEAWAVAADDVWAVGAAGLVEHWNGTTWTRVASGVEVALTGVWASGPNDVWIVGHQGTVLRWDGTALSTLPTGTTATFHDVHGTGPNDVWIAGERVSPPYAPGLRHWNGSALTTVQPTGCGDDLYAVFATSPTKVWVGGANETVCSFDGTTWTAKGIVHPYQDTVTTIWAGATNTFAIFDGDVYRYTGTQWTRTYSLPDVEGYEVPSLYDLHGTSDTNVWAVGSHGFVVHFDGATWTPTRIPGNAGYQAIAVNSTEAWAVGHAARARFSAGTWTESYEVASRQWLWEVAGTSPTAMWAIGSMGDIIRRTASGWETVASPFSPDNDHNYAVHVISANDVWIGGYSQSGHWNGQSLTLVPELREVRAFWSTAANDVWAVGESGMIAHYDGTSWTKHTGITFANLYALAGTSANDIWAGGGGTLLHYNGTGWSTVEAGVASSETVSTIAAIAPNDVWIAGESQYLRHFDGTTWTALAATTEPYKYFPSSFARAPDDVYFVLARRELLHWNGTTLEHESVPGIATVIGFGSTLWITGEDGLVLRR